MTGQAAAARLEEIAATAADGFAAAERRYRDRTSAVRTQVGPEPTAVRRLRDRLQADAQAADTVMGRLLLPAGQSAARPGIRR